MTTLQDVINTNNGAIQQWDGYSPTVFPIASAPPANWTKVESSSLPQEDCYIHKEGGKIDGINTMTSGSIFGIIPLSRYLKEVTTFDDNRLQQGAPRWTQWSTVSHSKYAIVEFELGPEEYDYMGRVEYSWGRDEELHTDYVLLNSYVFHRRLAGDGVR